MQEQHSFMQISGQHGWGPVGPATSFPASFPPSPNDRLLEVRHISLISLSERDLLLRTLSEAWGLRSRESASIGNNH